MPANKSHSRVTNRPPVNSRKKKIPIVSPHAKARRVTDLYDAYLARLGKGPHDAVTQANALRWAELTTICEGLRARALAGEDIDANAITRLEGTAQRIERAIAEGAEATAEAAKPKTFEERMAARDARLARQKEESDEHENDF
jgi:hypothetical protein